VSGDVTLQALKRLSFLPERPDDNTQRNGNLIAGQDYWDVYFAGGQILNTTITGGTINGTPNYRTETVVTATGNYQVLPTDYVVTVNKTANEATTVILEAMPDVSRAIIVKDGKGNASTYNITLLGNGNTIDGQLTTAITLNYGAVEIIYNGTEWNVINKFENFVPYTNEQAQDAVGSILTDTATVDFVYDDFGNTITANVIANSSNQQVRISKAGTLVGTRRNVNFIDGTNVVSTIADDAGNDRINITLTATGGGGGIAGPGSSTDNAVVRWDGTSGALTQNSVVLIGDTGAVTGVTSLGLTSLVYTNSTFTNTITTSTLTANRAISFPDVAGTLASATGAQTLTNKTLDNTNIHVIRDDRLTIQDNADTTKQFVFEASAITTATTRTLTVPNANTTLVGTDVAQTLTNKTINGTNNTITNVSLTTGVTGILPLANGGTGANLTDPNADRIMFWDDSAGATAYLTAGSGLNITGTTLTATAVQDATYTSSGNVIATSSLLTLNHGLGGIPDQVHFFLVCTTAQAGYSIGDIVPVDFNTSYSGGTGYNNCTITATQILVRYSLDTNCFKIGDKTTGGVSTLTNSSWTLTVKARKWA